MAKVRISQTSVGQALQDAKLSGSAVRIYDTSLTGFGFRAAVSGGGSYFLEYRLPTRGVSTQRYRLGAHGQLNPTDARELAQRLSGEVLRGIDIQAQKQTARSQAAGMRFAGLIEAYFNFRDDGTRYWQDIRGVFRREVPVALGNLPVELLTRADIRRLLDSARQKSPNVERWLFVPLNPMFTWAIERGYMEASPATGLSRPALWKSRERVLSQAELKAFLRAADSLSYPSSVLSSPGPDGRQARRGGRNALGRARPDRRPMDHPRSTHEE
jgi:integrase